MTEYNFDELIERVGTSASKQIPLASVSDDVLEHTITCIAPSKTFNLAGLQTSTVIIANEKLRKTYHNALTAHMMGGCQCAWGRGVRGRLPSRWAVA